MRINVYSQELTKEVQLIEQLDRDGRNKHAGVRLYMASPSMLHHLDCDDDRSAVTFWVPNCSSFDASDLALVFDRMRGLAMKAHYLRQKR